ncbi:hypothetical protein [Gimesia fumaroli]|uniref:Uncharacterized protein n=1 Tax=Gimesia fumaroli TaxID=2527976 RepID=A0A518I8Z2_9PLAN|nr:hypothetical protein [Gimesia fumaroli]QDV49570.1 hypothetical protein Enr17x_15900 [Gimesia fumaroli]
MRLYSTPQSANNLEVSLLAIIETIAAVSFSLWLAISYLGTWDYVLVGACVAPLLLLRTESSCNLALHTFLKYESLAILNYSQSVGTKKILAFFLYFCTLLFVPLLCRLFAMIMGIIKRPIETITRIPCNWIQICVCTDLFHPPELVPGIQLNKNKISFDILDFVTYCKFVFDISFRRVKYNFDLIIDPKTSLIRRLISLVIIFLEPYSFFCWFLVTLLLFYSGPIIYRFSLKSTSIVWAPLLWIIPKATPKTKMITRLKVINKSSWGRLISVVSSAVLVLFVFKILIFTGINELNERFSDSSILSKLSMFIEPHSIPIWQVASAANSLLALGLFWYASSNLIHIETGEIKESDDNSTIDYTLRTASVIRTSLSLYTISCLFYIVLYKVSLFDIPPLGDKFFPWQS